MTSPRPRSIFVGFPVKERVDVRVNFASMEIVLRVDAIKLGAFRVLTLMVEKFPVTACIVFVDMLIEEMEVASKYGVLMKSVAVKEVAVFIAVDIIVPATKLLTCKEEIKTEFLAARTKLPLSPVIYAIAPELPEVVWFPNIWSPWTAMSS
jgi:hypothetical protein